MITIICNHFPATFMWQLPRIVTQPEANQKTKEPKLIPEKDSSPAQAESRLGVTEDFSKKNKYLLFRHLSIHPDMVVLPP